MEPSVFVYRDYKSYLRAFISHLPRSGYGFRSRMAELMECEVAYVNQVLGGSAQLSLEQAESLQGVLHHRGEEAAYFLLLVQLARSKTPALRRISRIWRRAREPLPIMRAFDLKNT